MRAGPRSLAAVAAGLFLLAFPSAALADGVIGGGSGTLQQVTTSTTSTVSSTTEALGDALGDTQNALPPIDQVVSDTTATVTDAGSEFLVAVGQAVGGTGGTGSTSASTSSGPATSQSSSTAGSDPAADTTTALSSRSGRALSAASWGGFVPVAAAPTLGFSSFAPPPPRYGGEVGGALATTGANALLPIGVLVLLTVVGIGARTTDEVRSRIRMYGALTYHGKHRMPSRRRRLQLAFAG